MKKFAFLFFWAGVILFMNPAFAAQNSVGTVKTVTPRAWAEGGTAIVPLTLESDIFARDVLRTGEQGELGILFDDGTFIDMSFGSEIRVEDFVMSDADGGNSFSAGVARGTARLVTGEIARRNRNGFRISTPSSTIGIRGTTVLFAIRGGSEVISIRDMGERSSVIVSDRSTGEVYVLNSVNEAFVRVIDNAGRPLVKGVFQGNSAIPEREAVSQIFNVNVSEAEGGSIDGLISRMEGSFSMSPQELRQGVLRWRGQQGGGRERGQPGGMSRREREILSLLQGGPAYTNPAPDMLPNPGAVNAGTPGAGLNPMPNGSGNGSGSIVGVTGGLLDQGAVYTGTFSFTVDLRSGEISDGTMAGRTSYSITYNLHGGAGLINGDNFSVTNFSGGVVDVGTALTDVGGSSMTGTAGGGTYEIIAGGGQNYGSGTIIR